MTLGRLLRKIEDAANERRVVAEIPRLFTLYSWVFRGKTAGHSWMGT